MYIRNNSGLGYEYYSGHRPSAFENPAETAQSSWADRGIPQHEGVEQLQERQQQQSRVDQGQPEPMLMPPLAPPKSSMMRNLLLAGGTFFALKTFMG